jgi:ABC-type phosphate/phosphonate transport system permease subunit
MIQKIRDGLEKIDIFGQTISLTFRQEEKYNTSLGGFLSICIIGTIISFFYSNIINFFAMQNVTSTQEFTFADDPDAVIL